jgi:hypothetical protein
MGFFTRVKDGVKAKANAAIDKAIDPAKEIELAIAELEDQRKAALAELVSYKATAKQMEAEQQKQEERAALWEKRAMAAVKAGDDDAARTALREKKTAQTEAAKIRRDRDEAASYAIQLNKSRKEFETKLQILKLKKGTLATQLASARSPTGDAFGNDGSVWDQVRLGRAAHRGRRDRHRGRRRDARRARGDRRARGRRSPSWAPAARRWRRRRAGRDQGQGRRRARGERGAAGRGRRQGAAGRRARQAGGRGHPDAAARPAGGRGVTDADDTALITRLRDLALVDLDALLAGTTGDHHQALLAAHAGDLTTR